MKLFISAVIATAAAAGQRTLRGCNSFACAKQAAENLALSSLEHEVRSGRAIGGHTRGRSGGVSGTHFVHGLSRGGSFRTFHPDNRKLYLVSNFADSNDRARINAEKAVANKALRYAQAAVRGGASSAHTRGYNGGFYEVNRTPSGGARTRFYKHGGGGRQLVDSDFESA